MPLRGKAIRRRPGPQPPMRYPTGGVPIRSYFKKHLRRPGDPPRPGELADDFPSRYTPGEVFRPITTTKPLPHAIPPIRPATLRQTRARGKGKPWSKEQASRNVLVNIERKHYNILHETATEFGLPIKTILRLMVRRFVRRGILLSSRELHLADRDLDARRRAIIDRLMEELIFTGGYVRPGKHHRDPLTPARRKHVTRLVALRRMRSHYPTSEWERMALDSYKAFVARYFSDVTEDIEREHRMANPDWYREEPPTESPIRQPATRIRPEDRSPLTPPAVGSAPAVAPTPRPPSTVADFTAAQTRRRLVIRKKGA